MELSGREFDRTISLGLHDGNTENTGLAGKSNSLVSTASQATDNGSLEISDIGLTGLTGLTELMKLP